MPGLSPSLNKKKIILDVSSLSLWLKITIHLARKIQIALLFVKKVTILTKYLDFANIFLKKLAEVPLEKTEANKHAIKLKKKQAANLWANL